MKKSLFLLSWILLLSGCKTNLSADLGKDKEKFSLQEDFSWKENTDAFQYQFMVSSGGDNYYYHSVAIEKFSQDYHSGRVLLSPDKHTFFPFGYESEYTLCKDKASADKDKGIYPGVYINFKSTSKVETLYGYFSSQEISFYFTLHGKD
jgi:lipoprotein